MINCRDIQALSEMAFDRTNTNQKICVVGDIICDQYVYTMSNRLSPEASVPIFVIQNKDIRLGGAANVFYTVKALNVNAKLCGIIGTDLEGELIKKYLLEFNECGDMLICCNRPTTTKIRILSNKRQVLRIDREDSTQINGELEKRAIQLIETNAIDYKIFILSDYHKGLFSYDLAQYIIKICNANNIKVLVDAKKDFLKYKHSFLIKPNKKDLMNIIGCNSKSADNEVIQYCKKILKEYGIKYVYLTLGEEGGILIDEKSHLKIPSFFSENLVDATGAGDTMIATLAVALLSDIPVEDAVFFASYVAGISVTKDKTNCIERDDILRYAKYFQHK